MAVIGIGRENREGVLHSSFGRIAILDAPFSQPPAAPKPGPRPEGKPWTVAAGDAAAAGPCEPARPRAPGRSRRAADKEDVDVRIAIFGTGYVGLVTGACLAAAGRHVMCMDVDQDE